MEDRSIMPDVEGLMWQLRVCDIAEYPLDRISGVAELRAADGEGLGRHVEDANAAVALFEESRDES